MQTMNPITAYWLDILGNELYRCVDTILRNEHEVLVDWLRWAFRPSSQSDQQPRPSANAEEGYNIPSVTAGKITGMILEAYNPWEIMALLNDPNHSLGEVMADAVFLLAEAAA